MLGKTAAGLFWMFRYLERCENTARLTDAGYRMALTQTHVDEDNWVSVIDTVGARKLFLEKYESYEARNVIVFLLSDRSNPSSVLSCMEAARTNARLVRTAITGEVWEAVNESWMTLRDLLGRKANYENDLPKALRIIRQQSALVRGAMHGTMLRRDSYFFSRLGTFTERADSTARILDVKYYTLLPSVAYVGSSLDNVQWDNILRSVSAERAFRWVSQGERTPQGIAEFLILNQELPRSLAFCSEQIVANLLSLEEEYGHKTDAHALALDLQAMTNGWTINAVFESGLHEYIVDFLKALHRLVSQVEVDYRFNG